jgi:hypothetical protein
VALTALQVYKFIFVFPPHLSAAEVALLWGGTSLALAAKIAGYRAILAKDVHAFRTAHTAWHLVRALPCTSHLARCSAPSNRRRPRSCCPSPSLLTT